MGSYETLESLLYRGCQAPYSFTHTMKAMIKAWNRAKVLHKALSNQWPPYIPLWRNPNLPHLFNLLEPVIRPSKGIASLGIYLYTTSCWGFQSYKVNTLPNWYFFQLYHAWIFQFGLHNITLLRDLRLFCDLISFLGTLNYLQGHAPSGT